MHDKRITCFDVAALMNGKHITSWSISSSALWYNDEGIDPLSVEIHAQSIPDESVSAFLRGIAEELCELARKYESKDRLPEGISGNEPALGGNRKPAQ